ncbi:CCA tRNA nucleotidyltransferase [Clostridiaceae bacterium M8S5]|nr:CCA tRNA nucleotidyltransferase [Clostridiaceae bacterium M8S5]
MLKKYNYEAYIVGGCVRDSLIGRLPNDFDICTSCKPDKLREILDKHDIKNIPTGIKHGTITAVIEGNAYEITTYRVEGEYKDDRRPERVEFTEDILKDLSRRDFTINAIAYNPLEGLVDPFNGCIDIENKIIRCVLDAKDRFNEDALRIMRAVRFSSQLGYKLDERCIQAIKLRREKLKNISKERIREEFNKILSSEFVDMGIKLIKKLELGEYITAYDIFSNNEILTMMNKIPRNTDIRLSVMFIVNNISTEQSKEIMKKLKYDNKTIENNRFILKNYNKLLKSNDETELKELLRGNLKYIELLIKVCDALQLLKKYNSNIFIENKEKINIILHSNFPLEIRDLAINGDDLIKIGIKKGQAIGNMLETLLHEIYQHPNDNKKDILLKKARDILNQNRD